MSLLFNNLTVKSRAATDVQVKPAADVSSSVPEVVADTVADTETPGGRFSRVFGARAKASAAKPPMFRSLSAARLEGAATPVSARSADQLLFVEDDQLSEYAHADVELDPSRSASSAPQFGAYNPGADAPAAVAPKKNGSGLDALRKLWPTRKPDAARVTARQHAEDKGFTPLPLKVILGYFPEISLKDAYEYAQGVADKHFEQPGLVTYCAFEYDTGYIFEVHEGGDGRAFGPAIAEYFKSQGQFKADEQLSVVIRTATRMVEVQRLADGIATVFLPESTSRTETPWLKAGMLMTPAVNRRTAFFRVGLAVFASGVVAMLTSGLVFRLQPYDLTAGPKVQVISTANLPHTQWSRLEAVAPSTYVKALRFRENKWEPPELATEPPATPVEPSANGNSPPVLPPVATKGAP